MSDRLFVHPSTPPEPPYFRGVSFLSGEVGDLLYGFYGRSYNTMVVDGTSLKKRSGYIRAFDEVFDGAMRAVHHRESGLNYTIAADGEGIKIITALVPVKGGGNRFEHIAYPVDDFNRADSSTIQTASSGGNKYWQEGAKGDPSGSGTVYTGLNISSNTLQIANGAPGSADILIPAPSPFFVWRMEIDLSSFDPAGSANSSFGAHLALFHNVPMDHIDSDGAVETYKWSAHDILAKYPSDYRPASYVTAQPKEHPAMGTAWDFEVYQAQSTYYLKISQYHYFSEFATSENPDLARNGKRRLATSVRYAFSNLAELQNTHYLEVGQVQSGPNSVMRTFNAWINKDRLAARYATPDMKGARVATDIDAQHSPTGYYTVIADPNGKYGHAAFWGNSDSGTTGDIFVDNMVVAGGFLA